MKSVSVLLPVSAALLAIAALAVLQAPAADQPPVTEPTTQSRPSGPEVERWSLRPSLASQNPLQYKLLPDLVEQTPGNAVPLYLMAHRFWPDQKTTDEVLQPENGRFDYLDTPIDQFPEQYARKLLDAYSDTLAFVDKAARRDSAVWDDDWPDPEMGAKPLAYRGDLLHAANLLGFRARYQVSQRDWAAASYTLQTSFSMARQYGSAPMLIHAIQGSKFAEDALGQGVTEWIQRGDSPNLYWALTNLPQPFVGLSPAARSERMPVGQTLLDRAYRGEELPREQWGQVVPEMIGSLQMISPPYKRDPTEMEAQARRTIASTYPRATQYLISAGIPKEKVDAMAPDQAVGTYFCQEARATSDELWKSWGLPYPQAQEQMLRSWRGLGADQPPLVDNPLFQTSQVWRTGPAQQSDYTVPSLLRWRYVLSKVDRQIAMLRTIEALRDYAARHDGHPPARLDLITDLPVPPDPITGKPFDYAVTVQTVQLEALTPWWPRTGWRFELTFAK